MSEVTVFGLGNVLMRDDGLGPFAIRTFAAAWDVPAGVEVLDAGTPGLELSTILEDCGAIVVVDTVRADGPPGSLRLYRRDDVLRHPPAQRITPHDPGLKETLLLLELQGESPPEVLVVGVIPERVDYGVGLTDAVRAAVPGVVDAVVTELRRLGHAPAPRDPPGDPDIWWEEGGAA
ncbi:MAG: hydrogenase maturation protease [Gemmatimonadota bacterium]|nr:hydrogenase maturation protease [Gemmatimonadota bacterium]